jgi:hypothetical protein
VLRRLSLSLLIVVVASLGTAPAQGAEGPALTDLQAAVQGQSVEVLGHVGFDRAGASVGEDPPGDAQVPGIGTDLVGASITPVEGDRLRFSIEVADPIQAISGLPEVIHYNWPVNVVTGGETQGFEIQAMRTSVASDVRDTRVPTGEPVFQILKCSTNATGGRSCTRAGRVEGAFTGKGLDFLIPVAAIGARDGSVISPAQFPINVSVGVSGLAWVDNGDGGDFMSTDAEYAMGGVEVGIVEASQPVDGATLTNTEIAAGGAFHATLPTPPVHGSYLAVVRACEALTCASETIPFEVAQDAPPEEPFDPVLTKQQVFFHCSGKTHVENVDITPDGPATWDSTPPAGSLQDGDGCAAIDPPARNTTTQESPLDAVWKGTATGNLDSMTVRAYGHIVDARGDPASSTILARLTIDGTVVLPPTAASTLVVTPVAGSNGIDLVEFTITNLQLLGRADHERTHEVTFSLDTWSIDQEAVWVWDAVEAPAGITFNPESPAGPVLQVPDPQT